MTFKSKAVILGDDAGNGPKVPVSTSAPSGHSSGNRGIGFGEAVTAAVGNRTHEALADNTDDLNTRLSAYEAGGLDAVYDLGTAGPAGGGREITKDAGAVETTSALATLYGDDPTNAHFRANASGDTIAGGGGFDAVMVSTAAYGFLDRRVLDIAGNTTVTDGMAATLNPGGAGGTLVRLTGSEVFHTSGASELVLGTDLLEVLSGTYAGIYIITALGGSDTDVTVKKITGTSPTFSSGSSTTVRVCRPQLRSGSLNSDGSLGASVIAGIPGASAALVVNSGADTDLSTAVGADDMVGLYMRKPDGSSVRVGRIDPIGRFVSEVGPGDFTDTVQQRRAGGWAGFIKDYSQGTFGGSDHGGGFLAWAGTSASSNPAARIDFLSLVNHTITSGVASSVSITLGASSPTGVVTFTSPQTSDWEEKFPPLSFVYITTGAELGIYYVVDTDPTGNGALTLRTISGSAPAHFGTSGARTLVHYAPQVVGARLQSVPLYSTLRSRGTGSQTATPYNLMVAGGESDAAALVLTSPVNTDESTEMRALIRGVKAGTAGAHLETFLVEPKGRVFARDGFRTASGGEIHGDSYEYISTYSRSIQVPLSSAVASYVPPTDIGWQFSAAVSLPRWVSAMDSGVLHVPLTPYLRTGQAITGFEVLGTLGTGHSTAPAMYLVKRTTNWSTPAIAAETTVSHAAVTALSAGAVSKYQKSYTSGNTVSLDTEDWYLQIVAGDTAGTNNDYIHAVRITVTDVGPRNH